MQLVRLFSHVWAYLHPQKFLLREYWKRWWANCWNSIEKNCHKPIEIVSWFFVCVDHTRGNPLITPHWTHSPDCGLGDISICMLNIICVHIGYEDEREGEDDENWEEKPECAARQSQLALESKLGLKCSSYLQLRNVLIIININTMINTNININIIIVIVIVIVVIIINRNININIKIIQVR